MTGILPFLTEKHLNILFRIGVSLILIGIPFSIALMSIGSIWISCVYILEGGYGQKLRRLKSPVLIAVLLLLGVHLAGLMWTTDMVRGWKELLKILPLFSIPLVFSGISTISKKHKTQLVWLFVLAVSVSILAIYVIGALNGNLSTGNPRKLSIFTSHIRLSLFACFSICIVAFSNFSFWIKALVIAFLGSFIVVIQSLTGVIVLGALMMGVLVGLFEIKKLNSLKWIRIGSVFLFVLGLGFIAFTVSDYYSVSFPESTPELTSRGNKYNPELENGFIENGNYLWSYVSYDELETGFQKLTGKSIWEKNEDGFAYYGLLIRYLNNSGFKKDLDGIEELSKSDVERIMSGNPYPESWKLKGFSKRIRGILFHIEKSKFSPDFSGNSLAEKVVFQTAGWKAYQENALFGVGTGDLKEALGVYYSEKYPALPDNMRRKPHNQYLTLLILFGPLGLILFVYLLFTLWKNANGANQNISRAFIIVMVVSFLGEDTLANQAGITFFSLFIGLLFLLRTADHN